MKPPEYYHEIELNWPGSRWDGLTIHLTDLELAQAIEEDRGFFHHIDPRLGSHYCRLRKTRNGYVADHWLDEQKIALPGELEELPELP